MTRKYILFLLIAIFPVFPGCRTADKNTQDTYSIYHQEGFVSVQAFQKVCSGDLDKLSREQIIRLCQRDIVKSLADIYIHYEFTRRSMSMPDRTKVKPSEIAAKKTVIYRGNWTSTDIDILFPLYSDLFPGSIIYEQITRNKYKFTYRISRPELLYSVITRRIPYTFSFDQTSTRQSDRKLSK